MLEIFKTVEDTLTTCDAITEGSWIALSQPTLQELERVQQKTGIEIEDLKAPLDDEERSRIEVEDDYVMSLAFAYDLCPKVDKPAGKFEISFV